MKNIFLKAAILIYLFSISCEKNNDSDNKKTYEAKTIITNEKLIGGIVDSKGLLITLKAPTFSGFNYNTIPEILFLDNTGTIVKQIPIDTSYVNFKSEAYGGLDFSIPIGIKVDFTKNSSGSLFMSNNIDTFVYKIQDDSLIKYANVGPHISSISFDKNDNLYALREPYFTIEKEVAVPPVIYKVQESGDVQTYFTFPKDFLYHYGTGDFISWPNSDTWHMKPYPMSLFIDSNSQIFVSIMIMDKIFKIGPSNNYETFTEIAAPANLIENQNGDIFILQSHYLSNLTSTDHEYSPLKITNYSSDYEIFNNPKEKYDEYSYCKSATGKSIFLENQLSMAFDKNNQIIYLINSKENEILTLE